MSRSIEVRDSPEAVAADLAASLAALLAGRTAGREERIDIAVSGGFISRSVLPALAPHAPSIDWSKIRVWWVDERFVPAGHPDRNDAEAVEALFSMTPGVRLFPMPADHGQGLEAADADFTRTWFAHMAGRTLDLALIGMGPDGHVASLFPGEPLLTDRPVARVSDSPKPPPQRITLTMPTILSAERILLAAPGAAKAQALAQGWAQARALLDEAPTPAAGRGILPVAHVLAHAGELWTDAEGARLLPR